MYRMVHTTGNTKEGGLSAGLFNPAYSDILPLIRAERDPTARGIRIEMMSPLLFLI